MSGSKLINVKLKSSLPKSQITGFSLLEMSISLTIISLIVAAILTGQNIKKRAELNQIITDISTISSAAKQYKDLYGNALAGDDLSAESNFGAANTDNGNSDSDLDTGTPNEELLFWQHLSLAGLISGTYDGVTPGSGGQMATPLKYGYYSAHKAAGGRLYIELSKVGSYGILTTKEASDIDAKYDNGTPTISASTYMAAGDGTGETAGNCVNTGATPYTYNTTNASGTPCRMFFYLE